MELHDLLPGWLLRNSLQASVLVVVVLALQWILGRRLTAGWRHALWWVVIVRLLLPVAPESDWSLYNWLGRGTGWGKTISLPGAGDRPPERPGWWVAITPALASENAPTKTTVEDHAQADFRSENGQPGLTTLQGAWAAIRPALAPWWLCITGAMLLRWVTQRVLFAGWIRRRMRSVTGAPAALLERCRQEMSVREPVELLEGSAVPGPALYGVFRKRLLMPEGFVSRLSEEELRHVFLHELAHVRRWDLLGHVASSLLRIVYWFNPVVWLAFRRMRLDREMAADALVLRVVGEGQARAYGLTIVRVLECWSRGQWVPGVVGIVEDAARIEQRICAIAHYRPPTLRSRLAGVLVLSLGGLFLTDAKSQNPEEWPDTLVTNILESRRTNSANTANPSFAKAASEPEHSHAGQGVLTTQGDYFIANVWDAPATLSRSTDISRLPFVLWRVHKVKRQGAPQRVTRVFRVNPTSFISGLHRALGRQVATDSTGVGTSVSRIHGPDATKAFATNTDLVSHDFQRDLRDFFDAAGVSLFPPNGVIYKDRQGMLMVWATMEELEIIAQALEVLNSEAVSEPQASKDDRSSTKP